MVIEIHAKSKGVDENWHVEERTIRTDASLVGLLELRINVPPCLLVEPIFILHGVDHRATSKMFNTSNRIRRNWSKPGP